MNQYCRYCAFCIDGDGFYCEDMGKFLSEKDIKRANRCHNFALSVLGDVVTGKKYQPRAKRGVKDGAPDCWIPGGVQVTLWDED